MIIICMYCENGEWEMGIGDWDTHNIQSTMDLHEYNMNSTSVIYHMVQKNMYTYTTVHA